MSAPLTVANSVSPAKADVEFDFCLADPIAVFIISACSLKRCDEAFESAIQISFDNLCNLRVYVLPAYYCYVVTQFHRSTGKFVFKDGK